MKHGNKGEQEMKHGNVVRFSPVSKPTRTSPPSEDASQVGAIIPLPTRSFKALPAGFVSSDISLNKRLRKERRDCWRAARAKAEIWRVRIEMHDKIMIAQKYRLPEVRGVHPHDHSDRIAIVESSRAATMALILTPAPDVASVTWKRRVVERFSPWDWVGVKPELVQRAIADDDSFLKAHPTRRHRPK